MLEAADLFYYGLTGLRVLLAPDVTQAGLVKLSFGAILKRDVVFVSAIGVDDAHDSRIDKRDSSEDHRGSRCSERHDQHENTKDYSEDCPNHGGIGALYSDVLDCV